jgi:hypothetical protein
MATTDLARPLIGLSPNRSSFWFSTRGNKGILAAQEMLDSAFRQNFDDIVPRERIGVPLWQEDLWKEVIRAADTDTPDQTRFMDMSLFDVPAASQYAATTPELLSWFKGYNERQPEGERVFPFGFLLSLQAKSRVQMVKDDPDALSRELWRRREPRPAAPYFKRSIDAKDHAIDTRSEILRILKQVSGVSDKDKGRRVAGRIAGIATKLRRLNLHQNPAETLHIRRLENGLERPCGRSRPAPRHLASLVVADAFAG